MQIALIADDGTVLDSCDLGELLAEVAKEFPRDSRATHMEMAENDAVEEVRRMIGDAFRQEYTG